MDYSTISNKTNCTEIEEITNGELNERYYSLKKEYESLSIRFETTKQELHDAKRSYHTALDVQRHLASDLEKLQVNEEQRKNDFNNRITLLQEEISQLREERNDLTERHSAELGRLQTEVKRLKEEVALKDHEPIPERDTSEIEEVRALVVATQQDAQVTKIALEEARSEIASLQLRAEAMTTDMEQAREAAEFRREELRAANDREAVALAELAEVRAMLHQFTDSPDLQPHAAKGNSLFAEVEDKRQEMAKTLIQMKQTNSKLRRDLANKQAEVEALLHEKQTVWEQQLGAAAHYDRELIESYEERISQLEALTERQRRELSRWFSKVVEPGANGWLAGVVDHLKTEIEKLRAEVLSRGAAQLASAAQVRELRRKLAAATSGKHPATKTSPVDKTAPIKEKTEVIDRKIDETETKMAAPVKTASKLNIDDVKKRVTFN